MNQSVTIQRLTSHLRRIESEISDIRRELKALPLQSSQQTLAEVAIPYAFADKTALIEQMQQLFISLSIQSTPVGVEKLQQQMGEAELMSNELSQNIMAAREE
jgi:hypothetical protein